MATVTPTIEKFGDDAVLFSWTLTSADADGAPVGPQFMNYADRTVTVTGTVGTSSAYTIQGSNDGTNWGACNDLFGADLDAMTVNRPWAIAEAPLFVRPLIGTAGANASMVFKMFMRKARSGRAIGG